jgi:hypothetical protein
MRFLDYPTTLPRYVRSAIAIREVDRLVILTNKELSDTRTRQHPTSTT